MTARFDDIEMIGLNDNYKIIYDEKVTPEVRERTALDLLIRGATSLLKGKEEVELATGVILTRKIPNLV